MALLQIGATPIGLVLPSPAIPLLNRPERGLLPKYSRPPMVINNEIQ